VCVWRQGRYVTVSLGHRPRNLNAQQANAESANQFSARSQFGRREVNRAFGAKYKRETPRRLTQTPYNFIIRVSGFFRHSSFVFRYSVLADHQPR